VLFKEEQRKKKKSAQNYDRYVRTLVISVTKESLLNKASIFKLQIRAVPLTNIKIIEII